MRARREPDFNNLLKVLRRERPDRPTLFEFFMNTPLYTRLAGEDYTPLGDCLDGFRLWNHAFRNAGYDYTMLPWDFTPLSFPQGERHHDKTYSINEGGMIRDRKSFEAYPWPEVKEADYAILDRASALLPPGMKYILFGPGGVLENAISLVGFETLCLLIADDPDLVQEIFDAIGSRLVEHYRAGCAYDGVGAAVSNDDWGYKTQTMLSPKQLRRYVFPWHKRIVAAMHAAGKPAILHSCGKFDAVFDDVVEIGFEGRHSYEDAILPVEEAYDLYGGRIAILGGIDMDYLVRSAPDEIYRRSKAMLERSQERGGYALGSGNSIPEYVPQENYLAMIRAATE